MTGSADGVKPAGGVGPAGEVQPEGGVGPGRWGALVTTVGVVVAVWGAFVLAVIGVLLTPYRIGATLVPVSLVIVGVGNVALMWFAYGVTRRKSLALLPGLVWLVVSMMAAGRTSEGDLILTQNNWVATAYLIVGCVAIAGTAYRLFLDPVGRPRRL